MSFEQVATLFEQLVQYYSLKKEGEGTLLGLSRVNQFIDQQVEALESELSFSFFFFVDKT